IKIKYINKPLEVDVRLRKDDWGDVDDSPWFRSAELSERPVYRGGGLTDGVAYKIGQQQIVQRPESAGLFVAQGRRELSTGDAMMRLEKDKFRWESFTTYFPAAPMWYPGRTEENPAHGVEEKVHTVEPTWKEDDEAEQDKITTIRFEDELIA